MSFLDIFRRKRPETRVLDLLDKHLLLCVKAADYLFLAVSEKIGGNIEHSNQHIIMLSEMEDEADDVRRKI